MAASGEALTKAYLEIEGGGDTLPCLYNPASLQMSMSNSWGATKQAGGDVPTAKFQGRAAGTMSVTLQFDTTGTGTAVTTYTDKLVDLMKPDTDIAGADPNGLNKRPRFVVFRWGSLNSWRAVITSLGLTFTYFGSDGTPLRADASLSLQQYDSTDTSKLPSQNPTSGTPQPHRVHRVQPGETLDRISAHYYGDPTRWRALAIANGLEDPLAVRPGYVLAIPRLGES